MRYLNDEQKVKILKALIKKVKKHSIRKSSDKDRKEEIFKHLMTIKGHLDEN